jgi:hypothetical protein
MAAVAQTLFSTNAALVARNLELAQRATSRPDRQNECWDEDLFVSCRPDERGGYLRSGNLSAWMASHLGPNYADKVENQDAVFAVDCRDGLAFALADGVSTSLGSRVAAARAAARFCSEMRAAWHTDLPTPGMLIESARRLQKGMDLLLDRFLDDPDCPDLADLVRTSSLQSKTVEAVLANTRTAEKPFLQPALATTLIGGFVRHDRETGAFPGAVICIGDGAVERVAADGTVEPIFSTDPTVTEIFGSMGPGPLAQAAVEAGSLAVYPFVLNKGDHLLVSSDGLARGHQQSIWTEINALLGDIRPRLRSGDSGAVSDLLNDLARRAEANQGTEGLFDDNLSLIVFAAG